jgi:hypothetical protein
MFMKLLVIIIICIQAALATESKILLVNAPSTSFSPDRTQMYFWKINSKAAIKMKLNDEDGRYLKDVYVTDPELKLNDGKITFRGSTCAIYESRWSMFRLYAPPAEPTHDCDLELISTSNDTLKIRVLGF